MAWTLIKEGGDAENFGAAHKEFMIDSISDIDNEPTQYGSIAPGSFAYTGGYDTIFQKDVNGQWIEVSNGDGPHTLAWDNITGKPTVFPPDGTNLAAKGAVKITATTTGTQPSLNIAQGGPDVTGAASANIGNGNTVSGGQSLAVGAGNTVSGTGSIVVGGGCQATGNYSIAAGSGVKATANGSAAFGGGSEANAASSLAAGGSSTANGDCSVALGGGTVAGSACQIAVGKYNVEDEDDEYAVIVGNGSSSSRSNALTVDWSGNVESAGNLTIHYNGEEIDVGEAIASGGGGGGLSTMTITMTEEQVMSFMSDADIEFESNQFENFNPSNPPDVLLLYGEMSGANMALSLNKISNMNLFTHDIGYGGVYAMNSGDNMQNMVVYLTATFDNDDVFVQARGTLELNITVNPSSEIEVGAVPTYVDDGTIEWTTPYCYTKKLIITDHYDEETEEYTLSANMTLAEIKAALSDQRTVLDIIMYNDAFDAYSGCELLGYIEMSESEKQLIVQQNSNGTTVPPTPVYIECVNDVWSRVEED